MLELESSVDLTQFGDRKESAQNLVHYVALRRQDIREIQEKLSVMGISSLGRAESHVMYNLNAVIQILQNLAHEPVTGEAAIVGVSPIRGREILDNNAEALFGPHEGGRRVSMMATMPSEAATEYSLVRDLLAAGMDCMRINCAHDDESSWSSMIENLRRAEREVGRKCKVLMDIAGPKLRTGTIEPGPRVLRLKPERDAFGRVAKPAQAVLSIKTATPSERDSPSVLEVPAQWLRRLTVGDTISLEDSRASKRTLEVVERHGKTALAESSKTIYLGESTKLVLKKNGRSYSTLVANIPSLENPIVLGKDDDIVVTSSQDPGRPAHRGGPARVPCSLPEALAFVRPGERVWFDDGKIGGIVKSASSQEISVRITHSEEGGTKLKGDKGINLPDTDLKLPPLTSKDLMDLRFICEHADMVGYSFVRTTDDLRTLRGELAKLGREDMAMILKIETRKAFEQLPTLLLESLRGSQSGVMVARGDLAVECGYDRLAEVQEEILWMSEAAHMPTIWATQVLEGLTKNGIPSRAEVTDAAVGETSECVMLNKGPHMVDALRALDSILRRMQSHQVKKQSMMRQLNIAASFLKTVNRPAS